MGCSAPDIVPAVLPDHAVNWVAGEAFPMIQKSPGSEAQGVVLRNPTPEQIARLDFYEGGFAYDLETVQVQTEAGTQPAQVFFPQPGLWSPGDPWSLQDWIDEWSGVSMDAARSIMAQYGKISRAEAQNLLPYLRSRAWAQKLAEDTAPCTVRYNPAPEDVTLLPETRDGYDGFFRLRPLTLQHRQFAGGQGPVIKREAFVAYDAALVLPYDPVLDSVLLIEQLRYGPICRNDSAPWVLEPVAGLVDAGEDPEQTARREAEEEAGLTMGALLKINKVYPSPGYSSEFFHCYLGLCDLSGREAQLGGLDSEAEDIRSHVVSFDEAMALVETGEINAAPLAMMLYWLAARREDLRANQS